MPGGRRRSPASPGICCRGSSARRSCSLCCMRCGGPYAAIGAVSQPVSSERDIGSGRVIRHRGPDRLYHWLMAIAVLTLLGTAFLPILGWKFAWVDIHWMAGVVLAVLVV